MRRCSRDLERGSCRPELEEPGIPVLCPHMTRAFVQGLSAACDSQRPPLGAVPSDLALSPSQACVTSFRGSSSLSISHAEDFTVRLWPRQLLTLPQKTEDFPCGIELRGHEGPVSCCSFSTDGCSLATGGRDRVSYRRMQPQAPLPQILSPLGPTPLWSWIPEQLTYHCFLWPLALPNLLRWICPPACL